MRITDFVNVASIKAGLVSSLKKQALEEIVDKLIEARKIRKENKAKVLKVINERERKGSTGIGQGIAIPHARTDSVKDIVIGFGNSEKGVEFEALDGELVHIIFMMLVPKDSSGQYLKVLAKISRLLKDKYFRQFLAEAKTAEDVYKTIGEEDI